MNIGDIVVLSEDEVIDAFRDTNVEGEEYDPEEPYHQEELEEIRERLLADYRFGIVLKHNSAYGGYRIDYRMIDSTGEDWVGGSERMSAREMKCFMRGMQTALQLLRDEGKLKDDV